jgi:hypothetical protein
MYYFGANTDHSSQSIRTIPQSTNLVHEALGESQYDILDLVIEEPKAFACMRSSHTAVGTRYVSFGQKPLRLPSLDRTSELS